MDNSHNEQFARQEYWEERYKSDNDHGINSFEWIKGWDFYQSTLEPLIPSKTSRILHLGCGNSALSVDMRDAGYPCQENMDYSQVVIDRMQSLYGQSKPEIRWMQADIFCMSDVLPKHSYDVVIDKGTFDAFLTGWKDEDPWQPSEALMAKCRDYMTQVEAVLKPGGQFLQITWSQPHFRKPLLAASGMNVRVLKVGTDWEYFVFVCTRSEA